MGDYLPSDLLHCQKWLYTDNAETMLFSTIRKEYKKTKKKIEEKTKKKERRTFREECEYRRQQGWCLKGNTYLIKDEIKHHGGIWDKYEKCWLMPTQYSYDEMKAKLPQYTRKRGKSRSKGFSYNYCDYCGEKMGYYDKSSLPGVCKDCALSIHGIT